MASETAQKVLFVAVLGGLVAGVSWLSRAERGHAGVTLQKAIKPSAKGAPAPSASSVPPAGTPLDRVVEWEIPSTGCSMHQFGEALAVANDTLFVGAPWRDYAMQKDGDVPAACLYRHEGDGWSLAQKLVADEPKKSEGFARAVALTEGYAVVGAAGHENGDGPTHDYVRAGGKASLRALLEEPSGEDEVFEEYGAAVASDARFVVVGAHLHHDPACDGCGAAFVFHRDRPKGSKPTVLKGTVSGENLGTAAAISGDLLVLGGAAYYSNGKQSGAAVVFRYDGTDFKTVCRLVGVDAGEEYGASVAIDGTHVVVGAHGHGTPRFTVHEVTAKDCVPRGSFTSAGASVAIAGAWIAAGQPGFDGGAVASGRVALFHRKPDGTLEQRAWLLPKKAITRGWFGASVAIDGKSVFAGAPGMQDDGSAFVAGARLVPTP